MTRSGYTAYRISAQRPSADIIIFTDVPSLLSVLSLVWGVRGYFTTRRSPPIRRSATCSKSERTGHVKSGDIIHPPAFRSKNRPNEHDQTPDASTKTAASPTSPCSKKNLETPGAPGFEQRIRSVVLVN